MTYSFTDGGDGSLHVFRDGTYLCSIHGSEVSVVKNTTQSVVELSDSEHVFISINVNQVSGATTLQDIVDAIEVALPNDSDGGGGGGGGDIKSDGSVNFVGPETWNNGGADSVIIDTTNIELDSATNQAFITPAGFSTANAGAGTSAEIASDGTAGFIDSSSGNSLTLSPTALTVNLGLSITSPLTLSGNSLSSTLVTLGDTTALDGSAYITINSISPASDVTIHANGIFNVNGGYYPSLIDIDATTGVIVLGDKNGDQSSTSLIINDTTTKIKAQAADGFEVREGGGAALFGTIDINGITTSQGDLTATAPWKLGAIQNVFVLNPDPNNYLEVEVGGVVYKIGLVT